MRNKKTTALLVTAIMLVTFSFFTVPVQAASVALSADQQWIEGLTSNYEYITKTTYDKQNADIANNRFWTSLSSAGGTRPDGTKYAAPELIEGQKLQVASAWYGQDVYFRTRGSSGKGTTIKIPEYSQLKEKYKKAIKVFNAYSPDTGDSFYDHYITNITDENGYLKDISEKANIHVAKLPIEIFNKQPRAILTDAEGNYIYDLVAVGVCTDSEPDLSGAAAWALKEYIGEGYGFLIGHDTMYGYGGINADPGYVPDKNSTVTPMYKNNTKENGHWNMNWLMGVNKAYTDAAPYDAASLILNNGDYRDKSTLYGDYAGQSTLRIKAVAAGNPTTDIAARCPTNYPYATAVDGVPFDVGQFFYGGATHTNQQLAYGKVWIDFASNSMPNIGSGISVTDINAGLTGTNNFYLTTNGNFGMMQIGHEKANLTGTSPEETRILANTIMYLSQRAPCQVCQSSQGGNTEVHAVKRISSAGELARLGGKDWFNYPLDGCYELGNDIALPAAWQPIEGFSGHFDAKGHTVTFEGETPVFAQKGTLGQYNLLSPIVKGWNLGENAGKGLNKISNGGGVLTGVARVEGYLGGLFGTPSETDYSGYKIVITDDNGTKYDCVTSREGKYVVSNLPCTDNKYPAQVYAPDGSEVKQYGNIYAQIPAGFWKSCETIPLELDVLKAKPIDNKTVYEEQSAVFKAELDAAATDVKWEYKQSETRGWTDIRYAEFEYSIEPTNVSGGQTVSSLTVKNAKLEQDATLLRVTFTVNGEKYNTFDVKTQGNSGKLTVLERPLSIISPTNTSVWQGDDLAFTATASYYKSFDSGLSVVWQFRGGADCVWENISGSSIIENAYSAESVSATGDIIKPYASSSTLVIKNASLDYKDYQFRALYKHTQKTRPWHSAEAQADVRIANIICTQNPASIKIELNEAGDVPQGATAVYKTEFTYVSKTSSAPAVNWEVRKGTSSDYTSIPANILTQQAVGVPTATGKKDEYRVSATMTITNPNVNMDKGDTHYFFRAKATQQELRAYSDSADLSINYRIDIVPGEATVEKREDAGYDYTYDTLRIKAPNGLRSVRVKFSSTPADVRNIINLPSLPAGISVKLEGAFYVFSSSQLQPASVWQELLRKTRFTIHSDKEKIYWYVDELESELEYDPETGTYSKHIYEFVPENKATWTQSYTAARGRYNASLQTYGHLATINSAAENEKIRAQLGGWAKGWIGATSDASYNGGYGDMRWYDGNTIKYENQRADTAWQFKYMYMYPDGTWSRAPNLNKATVSVTDKIKWGTGGWNDDGSLNIGDWKHANGSGDWEIHAVTPERVDNGAAGDTSYTGIALFKDGEIYHKVELIKGNVYWFSVYASDYGASDGSIDVTTPFGDISHQAKDGDDDLIHILTSWWGETGEYEIRAIGRDSRIASNTNAQLYYCDLVDLTAAFTAQGADLPNEDWCEQNLVAHEGTQEFIFTSNTSEMQGYLVEYERNDFGFGRSNHSADATSDVLKPQEWTAGREGVRITVVDAETGVPYRAAFDLSRQNNADVTRHFGTVSKPEYRRGASLNMTQAPYVCAVRSIPRVIIPGGTNLPEVKAYFSSAESLSYIAQRVGLTKMQLTGGRYKIVLEPVIYLPVNGGLYAMTATEAAMYNAQHNDILRRQHKDVTHQALPFSLYLTEDDLGFKAWGGAVTAPVSDAAIVQNLGIAILRFGAASPAPNMTELRTDTDVYLACDVTAGSVGTSPDNPAWVQFSVNGETLTHANITLPEGGSQRAYVKWHTPSVPGRHTVNITSSANVSTDISAYEINITQIIENAPPDPTATDRNDYFIMPQTPAHSDVKSGAWIEYACKKENDKWVYTPSFYAAQLTQDTRIQPDERVPTAKQDAGYEWEMKSGYGINMSINTNVRSGSTNVIKAQTGIAYFPEFLYRTYNRVLVASNGQLSFAQNKYSQWENRVHFLPLWYPDGKYSPIAYIRDAWTPAGELQCMVSDSMTISGSVFDDWYVAKG